MTVTVSGGNAHARVIDPATGEEYVLHRTAGAVGAFVGMVRADHEAVLTEIAEACFEPDVFKSARAQEAISYVRAVYGSELEFLWKRFPETRCGAGKTPEVVWRSARRSRTKAGDCFRWNGRRSSTWQTRGCLRLVDGERYFPGYHMNKSTGSRSGSTAPFPRKKSFAGSTRLPAGCEVKPGAFFSPKRELCYNQFIFLW